jgi:hypothetical protein
MPDDAKPIARPEAPELSKMWETTWKALLDGHQRAVTHWLQALQVLADKVSALAATCLQLGMETWSALAACCTPEELIDCDRRRAAKTTERCSGEIAKISELVMRVVMQRPTDGSGGGSLLSMSPPYAPCSNARRQLTTGGS